MKECAGHTLSLFDGTRLLRAPRGQSKTSPEMLQCRVPREPPLQLITGKHTLRLTDWGGSQGGQEVGMGESQPGLGLSTMMTHTSGAFPEVLRSLAFLSSLFGAEGKVYKGVSHRLRPRTPVLQERVVKGR